jgi:hypothetical protein
VGTGTGVASAGSFSGASLVAKAVSESILVEFMLGQAQTQAETPKHSEK